MLVHSINISAVALTTNNKIVTTRFLNKKWIETHYSFLFDITVQAQYKPHF